MGRSEFYGSANDSESIKTISPWLLNLELIFLDTRICTVRSKTKNSLVKRSKAKEIK